MYLYYSNPDDKKFYDIKNDDINKINDSDDNHKQIKAFVDMSKCDGIITNKFYGRGEHGFEVEIRRIEIKNIDIEDMDIKDKRERIGVIVSEDTYNKYKKGDKVNILITTYTDPNSNQIIDNMTEYELDMR